jgi:hypothetical protein
MARTTDSSPASLTTGSQRVIIHALGGQILSLGRCTQQKSKEFYNMEVMKLSMCLDSKLELPSCPNPRPLQLAFELKQLVCRLGRCFSYVLGSLFSPIQAFKPNSATCCEVRVGGRGFGGKTIALIAISAHFATPSILPVHLETKNPIPTFSSDHLLQPLQ